METEQKDEIICGRNAVIEALRAEQNIDTLYISSPDKQGSIGKIRAMAKDNGLVVKDVAVQKLNEICEAYGGVTGSHQGVLATISCVAYATLDDLLSVSKDKGTDPFLIICDEIEDPHNLGAIIRTAEAAGADGVIIPKRRSCTLSSVVYKTSAGAAAVLPVCRVPNLTACIKELKKLNIWVYGADMAGQQYDKQSLSSGGIALVIGSEGEGVGRLIKEECDVLISLPMKGKINSLNASVAAGILMYEVTRQRNSKID